MKKFIVPIQAFAALFLCSGMAWMVFVLASINPAPPSAGDLQARNTQDLSFASMNSTAAALAMQMLVDMVPSPSGPLLLPVTGRDTATPTLAAVMTLKSVFTSGESATPVSNNIDPTATHKDREKPTSTHIPAPTSTSTLVPTRTLPHPTASPTLRVPTKTPSPTRPPTRTPRNPLPTITLELPTLVIPTLFPPTPTPEPPTVEPPTPTDPPAATDPPEPTATPAPVVATTEPPTETAP